MNPSAHGPAFHVAGKPGGPPKATRPERMLVAAKAPGRTGVAFTAEARPKGAPVRMTAAAPTSGGLAPLPAASKAALTKLAHAAGPVNPAKPTLLAGAKPGPAARRARVAEAN